MRVTKKIDTALKDLTKALEKHAQIVGLKPVPRKKAGRAAAELRAAATKYAQVVEARTGEGNPFVDFLDPATIASLNRERAAVAERAAAEKAKKGDPGKKERAAAEADAERAVTEAGAAAFD